VGLDGKSIYRGKELRAVKQASRYARQVHTASWCAHEHAVLQRLHEAGADVPRPLAHADNAILMEFIGDERGAAPTLQTVDLPRPRAHELLESLLWNVGLMLGQNLIHADLSAYNVLWWDDRGVIIDLPQAVSADSHPGAWALLHRDVDRLCRYFGAQGVECDAISLTQDLWRRWMG
jgi:RIO kinase 1